MLPSSILHVSALAPLASTLRTLDMAPDVYQLQQNKIVDYSALSSLSSLTALGLPLAADRQGLSSISSCALLQRLGLEFKGAADAAQQVTLQPSELSALGQLTRLTSLALQGTGCKDSASWSFLSSLRRLKDMCVVPGLPHAAVAALAHLTCLTELVCGWQQQDGLPQTTQRCAAVRRLFAVDGVPPLCAFPGLTSLVQCNPWDPAVFTSAAQCCTRLEALQLEVRFGGSSGKLNNGSFFAICTCSCTHSRCEQPRIVAALSGAGHLR
jgi:hypothetical protein